MKISGVIVSKKYVNIFLTVLFCFGINIFAAPKKMGVLQGPGEQGVRLATLLGKHTIFTGAKVGYDYRYKKWLQLGGEVLFDYVSMTQSESYTVMLGFLPKYRIFSVLKSRLALNAGLGLYGAYENLQSRLLEEEKSAWLYGLALHGELDFYVSSRLMLFGAGKQFLFPTATKVGQWRAYAEIGVKINR